MWVLNAVYIYTCIALYRDKYKTHMHARKKKSKRENQKVRRVCSVDGATYERCIPATSAVPEWL